MANKSKVSFYSLPPHERVKLSHLGIERFKEQYDIPNLKVADQQASSVVHEVPVMQSGTTTINGCVYKNDGVVEKFKERLAKGPVYGECGSPTERTPLRIMRVDPRKISHQVLDIVDDGEVVKIYITINPNTPGSQVLKGIDTPEFSMRSLVGPDDIQQVITWDLCPPKLKRK